MSQTAVKNLMTTPVERVAPGCALGEVLERVRTRRAACLVVCEGERPLGVVTERDLVRGLATSLAADAAALGTAGDLMSAPAVTVAENATLREALELSRENSVRQLPVVDADGRLVGIVSETALLRARSRDLEALHARLEESVAKRTQELMEVVQRLETLSFQDALLEIGNRRAMEATLDRVHETALRYDRHYALLLFDVDHFKAFNDHYGHAAGDDVLKQVAACLRGCLRRADSIYRYGGEEIVAVLPETDLASGRETGERLRAAVEALEILHEVSAGGVVTVSCGVAAWGGDAGEPDQVDWRELVERADRALYRAKSAGRNRVVAAAACGEADSGPTSA